jgi:hypothetical protein
MLNFYRRISIGKAALVALVASVAIVGYACGGGGDNDGDSSGDDNGPSATQTPADTGGGDNTTGSVTATAAEQATATSTSDANLPPAKGKVTYTYDDTKADGTPSSGTFTVYTDPPNVRSDTTESDGTLTVVIETPDATYFCAGSSSSCYLSSDTGNLESLFLIYRDWFATAQEQGISLTESSIAGTDAFCYSGEDNGETNTICISDDSLLLSLDGTLHDGTKSHWLATSYSTDVSDSDFEPPYPVITVAPTPAH